MGLRFTEPPCLPADIRSGSYRISKRRPARRSSWDDSAGAQSVLAVPEPANSAPEGRTRHRTARASASGQGPAPAGEGACATALGSTAARRGQSKIAEIGVVILHRPARHAPAVASRAGAEEMDLQGQTQARSAG